MTEPRTEDHAHYYRVIGATFMRAQMVRQLEQATVPAPAPEPTDEERYQRWLNSKP